MSRRIRRFSEVIKEKLAHCWLLACNGLNMQHGFDVSSCSIIKQMAKNEPKLYGHVAKKATDSFEFEKYLVGKSAAETAVIKRDFVKALLQLHEKATIRRDDAKKFMREFDNVITLNFDPFITSLYLEINNEKQEGLKEFHHLESKCYRFNGISDRNNTAMGASTEVDETSLGQIGCQLAHHLKEALVVRGKDSNIERPELVVGNKWFDGFLSISDAWRWVRKVAQGKQNFSYPHGAVHIYIEISDGNIVVRKLSNLSVQSVRELHATLIGREREVLLVLDHSPLNKIKAINQSQYLKYCTKELCRIDGVLYIYGIDIFKDTDLHIWKLINMNDNSRKTPSHMTLQRKGSMKE